MAGNSNSEVKGNLEFSVGPFPGNTAGVATFRQQLQQKLPQLNLAGTWNKKNLQISH